MAGVRCPMTLRRTMRSHPRPRWLPKDLDDPGWSERLATRDAPCSQTNRRREPVTSAPPTRIGPPAVSPALPQPPVDSAAQCAVSLLEATALVRAGAD